MPEFNVSKIIKYTEKSIENQRKNGEKFFSVNTFSVDAILSCFDKNADGRISKKELKAISSQGYSIYAKALEEYNKSQGDNSKIYSYDELNEMIETKGYLEGDTFQSQGKNYLGNDKKFPERTDYKICNNMSEAELEAEAQDCGLESIYSSRVLQNIRKERNRKDENSDVIDWHVGTFNQGSLKTCTLLARAGMSSDAELREMYSEKIDKKGNIYYEFNFPSDKGKHPVKVTKEELDNACMKFGKSELTGFSVGDADARLIEMAYIKRYGHDFRNEGLISSDVLDKFSAKGKTDFYSAITEELLMADTPKIIGLKKASEIEGYQDDVNVNTVTLESGATADFCTVGKHSTSFYGQSTLELADGTAIYGGHAYITRGYDPETKMLTLADPAESSTEIKVPFEALKLFVSYQ